MVLVFGCVIVFLALFVTVAYTINGARTGACTLRDPLHRLTVKWLADSRPVWETVDAFERDVERVMLGGAAFEVSRNSPEPFTMAIKDWVDAPPPCPSDSRMAKPCGGMYVVAGVDGELVTIHAGMAGPKSFTTESITA